MLVESEVSSVIDALVGERIDAEGPGVALAVVRDGEVVHEKGYGLANLEWHLPVTTKTVFGLGSTTKPFTATAILLLEAEGKLRLDDPITQHISNLPVRYEPITVRHLLTHTSGIPNYVTRPGFWEREATIDRTSEELVALFKDLPLDFVPGTDYSYSNSAYSLLGHLIERLSGTAYDEFVKNHVFAPLGMRDSCYLWHERLIPRRANGYARTDQGYQNARYISPTLLSAGGGLASTLDDMLRWDRALREHQTLDEHWAVAERPYNAATMARMQTPVRLVGRQQRGYGLGWGLSTYRGRSVVHHAGGVPGYSSFYGRFVEDGLSIIMLSNLAGFDAAGLAAAISNLVLELAEPRPIRAAVSGEQLESVAGHYRNTIGEALEVRVDCGALNVSGAVNHLFLPVSATSYYAAEKSDVTLRFEEPRDGINTQVTAVTPFYWFVLRREPSA
jgi:CubicO group peptidase (beta-lactamase class C family)